jgi:CDP-glycerol glycerophosphotransferase (TagB/SpsB family)
MKINKENLLKGLKNPTKAIIVVMYPLILKVLSNILKQNKSIIIFGAEYGQGYTGNSRIMYEWMLENRPDVRPVWITKNRNVYDRLKDKKPVELLHSFDGICALSKATVACVTHDSSDITSDLSYLSDSITVICLRHATGFIWNTNYLKKTNRLESAKQKRKIYDTIIANSKYEIDIETRKIPHDQNKYEITGFPRNDILINKPNNYSNEYGKEFHKFDNIILYAPTRRVGYSLTEPVEFFPFNDFSEEKLSKLLEKHNSLLLLRPHPRTIDAMESNKTSSYVQLNNFINKLCENKRITMAGNDQYESLESLMIHVDVLITDYSSIMTYQMVKKYPIIYIPYDITDWKEEVGIILNNYGDLPGSKVSEYDEFLDTLGCYLQSYNENKISQSGFIDRFYKFADGKARERVNEVIENARTK